MSDPYRYAEPEELLRHEVGDSEEEMNRAFALEALHSAAFSRPVPRAVSEAAIDEVVDAGIDFEQCLHDILVWVACCLV